MALEILITILDTRDRKDSNQRESSEGGRYGGEAGEKLENHERYIGQSAPIT